MSLFPAAHLIHPYAGLLTPQSSAPARSRNQIFPGALLVYWNKLQSQKPELKPQVFKTVSLIFLLS